MDRKRIRQLNQVSSMLNVIIKQFSDIKSVCGEIEPFYYCDLNEEEIESLNEIQRKKMEVKYLSHNIDTDI